MRSVNELVPGVEPVALFVYTTKAPEPSFSRELASPF
jgi:hypothetical protein